MAARPADAVSRIRVFPFLAGRVEIASCPGLFGRPMQGFPVIISHSHSYIFVHLHKTGGTSMERALAPHLAWNDIILGTTELGAAMQEAYAKRYGLSDHASVEEIAHVCGAEIFSRYHSFALVRHPVDRVLSMYNFLHSLCTYRRRSSSETLCELRRLVLQTPADDPARTAALREHPFLGWTVTEAFLAADGIGAFVRSPLARCHRSFHPQAELLATLDGQTRIAQAIRLEDIALHLPGLERRLGHPLSYGHHNRSEFRIIDRTDLSDTDRIAIETLFEADMLAFDYH